MRVRGVTIATSPEQNLHLCSGHIQNGHVQELQTLVRHLRDMCKAVTYPARLYLIGRHGQAEGVTGLARALNECCSWP